MATVEARPNPARLIASAAVLTDQQTADGDSDNVVDRRGLRGPCDLVVDTVDLGASQTVTINIVGSSDGTNWWNVPYALVATPSTFVVAAITETTQATKHYLLQGGQPWRYLKLVMSSTTNMETSASVFCYPN